MNYNLPISSRWTAAAVLTISLSVAALGLNACFSDRAPTVATANTAACLAPANTAGTTVIFITAFTFQPTTVHVKAGGSVAWVNCEPTAIVHTTTSDGSGWDSGLMAQNKDFVRTFSAAGTFPYHCAVHPSMKATIIVD